MKKITKTILFIAMMFVYSNLTYAQDMITMKTGEDINAKVLEVTTSEIKYKKTDMPDGPIFSLLKSEVLIIRYANGTKDVFNNQSKEIKTEVETNSKEKKLIQGKKVSFGVKGGLNYSNLAGQNSNKPIVRYHVGAFSEIKINPTFSFQPELQFSAQGFMSNVDLRQNAEDPVLTISDNIDLSYINVPILAKFNINNLVNVVIGPQIGVLVMAKSENWGDIKGLFNTVDFGLNLGGGLTFNSLIIDLRYNLGLSEVPAKELLTFGTSSKNSVVQLSLGYKF